MTVSGDSSSEAPGRGERSRPPRDLDPLGKRALFWAPVREVESGHSAQGTAELPLGKRALFSSAPAPDDEIGRGPSASPLTGRGPILVTCSACGVASRVGLVDFLFLQLPLGYWLPRGRFDHRMTCPACRQRVWAGVTLRRS
jgi:hypothetical protein